MDRNTKTLVSVAAIAAVALVLIVVFAGTAAGAAFLLTRDNARSQDNFALSKSPGSLPQASIFTASTSLLQPSMVVMKDEESRNRFSLSGELQELNDSTFIVAGQTVELADPELNREALQVGAYVIVQGTVDADGTLVAETVYPTGS
jgi:hypothetical protein